MRILIPAVYKAEIIPKELQLDTRFGKYAYKVMMEGDQCVFIRFFESVKGRFTPSEYSDLVRFYDQVYKTDQKKLVLVKVE